MPRISFDFKNKKNNWINKCLLVRVLVLKHFELNSQMCRHCRLIALINLSPLEFRWMARTCRYRASRFLLAHNWNFCFFLYRDSCDSSEINCKPFFVFFRRCVWQPTSLLKFPAIWDKKTRRIDWTTIHRSAIQRRIRRFRRRRSATKYSSPMCWPAQSTIFGCTTQMQRITIYWHGPCRLQQVRN